MRTPCKLLPQKTADWLLVDFEKDISREDEKHEQKHLPHLLAYKEGTAEIASLI